MHPSKINSERDFIIKGWEKETDENIIKDVATKGKNISLCITFLAKRNKILPNFARKLFLEHVGAIFSHSLCIYKGI